MDLRESAGSVGKPNLMSSSVYCSSYPCSVCSFLSQTWLQPCGLMILLNNFRSSFFVFFDSPGLEKEKSFSNAAFRAFCFVTFREGMSEGGGIKFAAGSSTV